MSNNTVKNPIIISGDDLVKVQAHIAVSTEMERFSYNPEWFNKETNRKIVEGIVSEMMKNNLIRIEESEGPYGKIYSAKVMVYDKGRNAE